jgi:hypothetical protein
MPRKGEADDADDQQQRAGNGFTGGHHVRFRMDLALSLG